jgi:hypothetical protein
MTGSVRGNDSTSQNFLFSSAATIGQLLQAIVMEKIL